MTYDKSKYFQIIDNPKVKTSELVAEMKKLFPVYCYREEHLDEDFPAPKKKTIRYFHKNVEADEDMKNLSANDLKEKGIVGITLRERLIMELQFYQETGNHLDIENWTLCSGSRCADGDVPCARWDGGDVSIYWYVPQYRHDGLRARRAVSLDTSSFNTFESLSLDSAIRMVKNAGMIIYKPI